MWRQASVSAIEPGFPAENASRESQDMDISGITK